MVNKYEEVYNIIKQVSRELNVLALAIDDTYRYVKDYGVYDKVAEDNNSDFIENLSLNITTLQQAIEMLKK